MKPRRNPGKTKPKTEPTDKRDKGARRSMARVNPRGIYGRKSTSTPPIPERSASTPERKSAIDALQNDTSSRDIAKQGNPCTPQISHQSPTIPDQRRGEASYSSCMRRRRFDEIRGWTLPTSNDPFSPPINPLQRYYDAMRRPGGQQPSLPNLAPSPFPKTLRAVSSSPVRGLPLLREDETVMKVWLV